MVESRGPSPVRQTRPLVVQNQEGLAGGHQRRDLLAQAFANVRTDRRGRTLHLAGVGSGSQKAEGFARELRNRTRDGNWLVYRFKTEDESRGPVAPLDIYQVRPGEGRGNRIISPPRAVSGFIRAYPHSKLTPRVTISEEDLDNIRKQHGDLWWNQVCTLLTGLSEAQVGSLGGYRVILPDGEIGFEGLP